MKSLWIAVAVMSLSIAAEANHNLKASVVFRSQGDYPIVVRLDGQRNQQSPRKVVQFNNLRPGRHYVQIYKIRRQGYWGSSHRDLVYSGYVRIRDGFKTVYGIHHGNLRVLSQKPVQAGNGHGHGNGHGYGHGHGNGYGHGGGQGYQPCGTHGTYNCGCDGYPRNGHPNWGHPINEYGCYDGHCTDQCGGSCGYGSYNNNNQFGPRPGGGHGNSGHRQPISNSAFESILRRSDRYFSDEQKVRFYLRELDGKYIKTAQARRMVDDLFFEKQKYHLLTSLYEQVVDPDRFRDLSSVFYFNQTRNDFEDYFHTNYRKTEEKKK